MEVKKILVIFLIIIFGLINFFISFLLFLIHCKQSNFKQRFFKVIYYIIGNECLISLIIIIVTILKIFDFEKIYIFGIFFYVIFNIIIIYNLQILFKLFNYSEMNNDLIKKDIKSPHLSVSFTPYNFKKFHLLSFSLSIIYMSIFFFIYKFKLNIENKLFILSDDKKKYLIFIFFLPLYLYTIVSFIYFFSIIFFSSKKIKIKIYSFYTITTSFIYLLIPLSNYIIMKKNYNNYHNISNLTTYSFHLLCLCVTNLYRINCIYVKSVLNSNDEGFGVAFKKGLKIIFCGDTVKGLNIIDFNNPYIYHSLSTKYDFDINNDKNLETDANISKFAPDL